MGKSEQVSIAVIVELDKYLVELRTKKTSNGALGKLACLGGGVEEKDKEIDPKNPERQAVWREVTQEETRGLALIKPENFKRKGIVRVESDRNGSPVDIEAHVYELLIPLGSGELILPKPKTRNLVWLDIPGIDIARGNNDLSPASEAAFREIYEI
jgi:hypothetical protein